jgi:hypothetical protein
MQEVSGPRHEKSSRQERRRKRNYPRRNVLRIARFVGAVEIRKKPPAEPRAGQRRKRQKQDRREHAD